MPFYSCVNKLTNLTRPMVGIGRVSEIIAELTL